MDTEATSAVHGVFTITRELPHAPERVYAAWSDAKAKAAWFSAPSGEWTAVLATIVLEPARVAGRAGTRMSVTEQGAFLDGYDDAGSRERGTGSLMDPLARSLEG